MPMKLGSRFRVCHIVNCDWHMYHELLVLSFEACHGIVGACTINTLVVIKLVIRQLILVHDSTVHSAIHSLDLAL